MCPKLDGFPLDPLKSVDEGSAVMAHSHRYISQNLGAVYSLNSSQTPTKEITFRTIFWMDKPMLKQHFCKFLPLILFTLW